MTPTKADRVLYRDERGQWPMLVIASNEAAETCDGWVFKEGTLAYVRGVRFDPTNHKVGCWARVLVGDAPEFVSVAGSDGEVATTRSRSYDCAPSCCDD